MLEEELPICLPDLQDFEPTGDGRSPLAKVESSGQRGVPEMWRSSQARDRHHGWLCLFLVVLLRFASPRYADGPIRSRRR